MAIFISFTIATVIIWIIIEKYRNVHQLYKQPSLESLRKEATERNPLLSPADQMNALYRYRIREIIMLRRFDQDTDEIEGDLLLIINEVNRLIVQEVEETGETDLRQFDEMKEFTTTT
ncbi:MAG: hypothetical protein NTX44_02885 [Ignavibacteriales bacterium]|nr:hypothetical protein [Ignavibacteriales bacterium]